MNPIITSRLLHLIELRSDILLRRDDLEDATTVLRRINRDIIDVIDRWLDMLGVPAAVRQAKSYKVRTAFPPASPRA